MPFEPALSDEPHGPLVYATRAMADMLAECASFRAEVGAEDQAEALRSIYPLQRVLAWPEDPDAPFAVVWTPSLGLGGHPLRLRAAQLLLDLSLPAKRGEDFESGPPRFLYWCDSILGELADLSGVDDRPVIQDCQWTLAAVPDFNAEQHPCWKARFELQLAAAGGD